jgi:chromosomal replication initiator protein
MEDQLLSVWSKVCRNLKEALTPDTYERWIAVIQPRSLTKSHLSVSVSNDFYQYWLEENYLPLIRRAVSQVVGRDMDVRLEVDSSLPAAVSAEPVERPPSAPAKASRAPAPVTALNPNLTFDSFVVGPSNTFAHAAAFAVAQSPARAYNPLLIYGGVGLGKTHLMQAIGHHVVTQRRNANVSYLSSEALLNEYIDALQNHRIAQFRRKYRHADVLLVDDIQFLAGKDKLQEEFFHTFNTLYDAHKQIVLSCDRPASDVGGLEPRLVSRFEWGLVTELETPDLETRIAILRQKQKSMNLALPDPLLVYIAEHIRSNIRKLEGALIRAASYTSLTGRTLPMETLESLLRHMLDKETTQAPSVDSIQKTVAEHFDLRLSDMTSKRRPQSVALPRQVAMYLCRTLTPHSLPTIGEAFGRNHATVIHACRLIDRRMKSDPQMRQTVSALRHKLGAD